MQLAQSPLQELCVDVLEEGHAGQSGQFGIRKLLHHLVVEPVELTVTVIQCEAGHVPLYDGRLARHRQPCVRLLQHVHRHRVLSVLGAFRLGEAIASDTGRDVTQLNNTRIARTLTRRGNTQTTTARLTSSFL